jgi:hypothetical protein
VVFDENEQHLENNERTHFLWGSFVSLSEKPPQGLVFVMWQNFTKQNAVDTKVVENAQTGACWWKKMSRKHTGR